MKIKKLYIMNFNMEKGTGPDIQEIDTNDFIGNASVQLITKEAEKYGLVVEIKSVANPEKFLRNYYLKQGYNVFRCKPTNIPFPEENVSILLSYGFNKGRIDCLTETGVPDYLCIKGKNDYFFVEVKDQNDSFHFNQVKWLTKHRLPTKIIFVSDTVMIEEED